MMEEFEGDRDVAFMWLAVGEARRALAAREVPVGVVFVDARSGEVVHTSFNHMNETFSPTAHAEVVAIDEIVTEFIEREAKNIERAVERQEVHAGSKRERSPSEDEEEGSGGDKRGRVSDSEGEKRGAVEKLPPPPLSEEVVHRAIAIRDSDVVPDLHRTEFSGSTMRQSEEALNLPLSVRTRGTQKALRLLHNCDLYVTVEPCIMCAGAIARTGVRRVIFGCRNSVFGGCGSVGHIHAHDTFPEDDRLFAFSTRRGVLESEAVEILRRFYLRGNVRAPRPRRPVDPEAPLNRADGTSVELTLAAAKAAKF